MTENIFEKFYKNTNNHRNQIAEKYSQPVDKHEENFDYLLDELDEPQTPGYYNGYFYYNWGDEIPDG